MFWLTVKHFCILKLKEIRHVVRMGSIMSLYLAGYLIVILTAAYVAGRLLPGITTSTSVPGSTLYYLAQGCVWVMIVIFGIPFIWLTISIPLKIWRWLCGNWKEAKSMVQMMK